MKYIALLRGINIGNKNRIKMTDLRNIFESMGFKDVNTYLQSGNVIFKHDGIEVGEIESNIEEKINQTFGFNIDVIIRTEDEFESMISSNPFIKDLHIEFDKLHVTFLKELPDIENILNLNLNIGENEKLEVKGKEIYLYLPNGYARTKLTNNILEKKLKTIATTRNWKTANKLFEI